MISVVTAPSARNGHQPTWQIERIGTADVLRCTEDIGIQWHPGERLHDLFDAVCADLGRRSRRHTAFDYDGLTFSYGDLRDRSTRLAHHFADVYGIGQHSRVGVLLDRSFDAPATVLALSRLGAAYLPLDASFPPERVAFMLDDTGVSHVVTTTDLAHHVESSNRTQILLDLDRAAVDARTANEFTAPVDDTDPLAYVIYTSGSTGRPKGVPIRQSSLCNFVRLAVGRYGYQPDDRVYQGLTMAFDFSIEELWVPLLAGATLVPAPTGFALVGDDLTEFLRRRGVTALVCVPTVLATVNPHLPQLRLLLVSGEACPDDLIARWLTPHRRVLNAYGPTETTVTATWSVLAPGRVTIGGPLPTYSVVVLDPDGTSVLAAGATGELAIGGVALSDGYLNRPDQTNRAFVADVIGLPDNPSGRLYRTGDLGRINQNAEIEYLGRIDTQIKIRGYRIEVDEIEAVARTHATVANVVVDVHRPDGGDAMLVAYLTPAIAGGQVDVDGVDAVLRKALPTYMIPAYYEVLAELPLLSSTKVDRSSLPSPRSPRHALRGGVSMVSPRTPMEERLSAVLVDVLGLTELSVEADFFDHLGADSLSMAAFVTAIRQQNVVRRIALKQIYQHSTIATLATELAAKPTQDDQVLPCLPQGSLVDQVAEFGAPTALRVRLPEHRASRSAHMIAGLAQVAAQIISAFAAMLVVLVIYQWVDTSPSLPVFAGRAVLGGAVLFFGGGFALIGIKWVSIGRFTIEPIPLWSIRYVRFWIARQAIRINPFNLLAGTPLYNNFLRLLGMKVGSNTTILSLPPTCTDLVVVGSDTVVRRDVVMPGYRAHDGWLRPGLIKIGDRAVVAEGAVIDIGSSVGSDAKLGATSGLLEGQHVPDGSRWQGSPAVPTESLIDSVQPVTLPWHARTRYGAAQLVGLCLVTLPSAFLPSYLLAQAGWTLGTAVPASGAVGGVIAVVLAAGVVYLGSLATAVAVTLGIPRVLHRFVRSGEDHPLWGAQYHLARTIERTSNNRVLNTIFGDSSMILCWLSAVGYDLRQTTQTGTNFGVDQRHGNPFLVTFGQETLVSDGLRLMNLEVSATSFRADSIEMPSDTYLGNNVHFPPGARIGANCLIATKAAVPVDGPLRTDVGILGSPAFEIPRTVVRDRRFDHLKAPGVREERLRAKLRSNVGTMLLYLLRSWMLMAVAIGTAAWSLALTAGASTLIVACGLAIALSVTILASALVSIFAERAATGFRALEPLYCSLYDPRFWAHERFWKLNYNAFLTVFDGTPLKPLFLRLQGAKVGRMVFDDGVGITEPSLVSIGDYSILNFGSTLQAHSLEDGTFKSDRIAINAACTLDTGAFVHYGVRLEEGATVDADAFVMKGSTLSAESRWQGNPAREVGTNAEPAMGVTRAVAISDVDTEIETLSGDRG